MLSGRPSCSNYKSRGLFINCNILDVRMSLHYIMFYCLVCHVLELCASLFLLFLLSLVCSSLSFLSTQALLCWTVSCPGTSVSSCCWSLIQTCGSGSPSRLHRIMCICVNAIVFSSVFLLLCGLSFLQGSFHRGGRSRSDLSGDI